MKKSILAISAAFAASPALAASGPFFSLANTNFVVLCAFIIFVGVVIYVGVPKLVGGMLDQRAETVQGELDQARSLREEAQSILAEYERKQKEVEQQSKHIVENAKAEAEAAAKQAKADIKTSIKRRLQAAEDQIASAQAAAVKEVRDTAVTVAIASAQDVIAKNITATASGDLIDDAITQVEDKLH